MRALRLALLIGTLLPAATFAQPPAPAPLMYVEVGASGGSKVAFYRGPGAATDLPMPARVGLRPGYIYRFKVSGFANRPDLELFPTLEVRGTLWSTGRLNPAEYPAAVNITDEDVARVLAGSVVTKVIVVEDPDRAVPESTTARQPLELDLGPGADVLAEARLRGRPVLILRIGERAFSEQELVRQSIQGTVLLPGERALSQPAGPPHLPMVGRMFFDPILGPRLPHEECLFDGGDSLRMAGLDATGQPAGIAPSDTVARYADSAGVKHLAVSNRICLCVPRYVVLTSETHLGRYENTVGTGQTNLVDQGLSLRSRLPAGVTSQAEELSAMRGRTRASGIAVTQTLDRAIRVEVIRAAQVDVGPGIALATEAAERLTTVERARLLRQAEFARSISPPPQATQVTEELAGTAVVGIVAGLKVWSQSAGVRDFSVSCERDIHVPDRPLVLLKWADRQSAQVGDVVTFYLKYKNVGGQPISDVAVIDSLTGRLEYVPGSAHADRDALFTTQTNEAGSLRLQWELRGILAPGQSGVVTFQARVR